VAIQDHDRHSDELKIFHDVAKALTSTLDLDTILQTIMEKMAAYFEPATWSLVMVDDTSHESYCAASVGRGAEGLARLRLTDGTSLPSTPTAVPGGSTAAAQWFAFRCGRAAASLA